MILTITEISKENHESRAVKIANHATSCYAQSRLSRLIWARSRIMLMGPIKRHGKPLYHPCILSFWVGLMFFFFTLTAYHMFKLGAAFLFSLSVIS